MNIVQVAQNLKKLLEYVQNVTGNFQGGENIFLGRHIQFTIAHDHLKTKNDVHRVRNSSTARQNEVEKLSTTQDANYDDAKKNQFDRERHLSFSEIFDQKIF